ncbi:hypothetical protein SGLAM104S_01309 [Streptomyces glaucescens]
MTLDNYSFVLQETNFFDWLSTLIVSPAPPSSA